MHPFPTVMLMSGRVAKFVGGTSKNNDDATIAIPALALVGDLALIASGSAVPGWSTLTQGGLSVSWKVLVSGDLSGVALGSSVKPAIAAIYRGARSASKAAGANSATCPGFTKSPGALAVVAATKADSNYPPAAPSGGLTLRAAPGGVGAPWASLADGVPASNYVNGTNIVWTAGTSQSSIAIELF